MFHSPDWKMDKKITDESLRSMVTLLQDPLFCSTAEAQNAMQKLQEVTVYHLVRLIYCTPGMCSVDNK